MTPAARTTQEQGRSALIYGTFDVDNFGDLLFPIVAAHRLGKAGWTVLPVSPTDGRGRFDDALPAHGLAEVQGQMPIDAVLIGGGDIVHGYRADFLREYAASGCSAWAYAALWLGATATAALADAPVAWNAPGLPSPLPDRLREGVLQHALAAADYVAVRDQTSRQHLRPDASQQVEVVPDTVAGLAEVWPAASLDTAARALRARKGLSGEEALLALHIRPGGLDPRSLDDLTGCIAAFCAPRGLTPLLLSASPCLGDADVLRAVSRALPIRHALVDDPGSLREVVAALATSRMYVGNSMHCYIAAAAYGVPGTIVARPSFRKFLGFTRHLDRTEDVAPDWPRALERAAGQLGRTIRIGASVTDALDRHWDGVTRAIADPAQGRAARLAFLRALVGAGIDRAGFGWLLRPFEVQAPQASSRDQPDFARVAATTGSTAR